jgi:putative transposase
MLEHFDTKAQARKEIVAWIEDYNAERRHSALSMRAPLQHEQTLRQDDGQGPGAAA